MSICKVTDGGAYKSNNSQSFREFLSKTAKSKNSESTITSLKEEISNLLGEANIDIGKIPLAQKDRNNYMEGIASLNIFRNITISDSVYKKIESDPYFKKKVMLNLQKEFSQVFPSIPGMKLMSHGAVVNEDGSVGGWAVGGPESTKDINNSSKSSKKNVDEKRRKYLEQKMLHNKYMDMVRKDRFVNEQEAFSEYEKFFFI